MKPVVVVIIVRTGSRGLDLGATRLVQPLDPGRRVQFLVGLWRNRFGILPHREGLAHLPALAARLALLDSHISHQVISKLYCPELV